MYVYNRSVLIYKEYIPLRNPSFLLFSVVIVCMEVESLPSAGWLVRRVPAWAVGMCPNGSMGGDVPAASPGGGGGRQRQGEGPRGYQAHAAVVCVQPDPLRVRAR